LSDGIPSPNPNYIEPIKNVTGNSNVKIQNKNLFKFNNEIKTAGGTDLSYYNVNYSITNQILNINGTMSNTNTFILSNLDLEAGTYTISFDVLGGSVNNPLYVSVITENGTKQITLENSNISSQIVATGKIQRIDIYIGSDRVFTNYQLRCQLEQGTTATSYVEHQEQNLPFTFEAGQRLMQGGKLQDVGIYNTRKQIVLDGTEAFWNLTMDGDIPCFWFRNTVVEAKENPHNKKCNYFIYSSIGFKNAEINTLCENTEGSAFSLFVFKTNVANSIETWKQWLAQQYANGTPVIVEYELAESELENNIIPYNETQQAQYNAIKEATSYDDITYITSESDELGFDMKAIAVADANKVIDSLDTRLLALESEV